MLSWVQYAYGAINADVSTPGWFIIGPITGPSVITAVRVYLSLNQFSTFKFGFSVVTKPEPDNATYQAGVRLIGKTVASSVANTVQLFDYSADGSSPVVLDWPCWVPIPNTSRWVSMFAERIGGAANIRGAVAVRADRLWPNGGPEVPQEPSAAPTVRGALETLRARARRS